MADFKYLGHTEDWNTGERIYRISDRLGNITYMRESQLVSGKLSVQGIITVKNRVIVKKYVDMPDEFSKLLTKSKMLGLEITKIPTYCDSTCYLIRKAKEDYILIIPPDVQYLNKDSASIIFTMHIDKIKGKIKVIGGDNLESLDYAFLLHSFVELDLTELNTSKVNSMEYAFRWMEGVKIQFGGKFNTSNVQSMQGMFEHCILDKLDLSSFDTHRVVNMREMFKGSIISNLDIHTFNTANVRNFSKMFYKYGSGQAMDKLNLSHFTTDNAENLDGMFLFCTSNVTATDANIIDALDINNNLKALR